MTKWLRLAGLVVAATGCMGQSGSFRYFYDDANELFRVLDSTGTLIEYDYDPSGNITQVNRSTVPPTALSILNVTPLSGATGQNVTIYGQNFSSSAAGDTVQFGGVTATVVSASSGALVVQVPAGFTNGQITVTVNGVTANSGSLAFLPPPSITSVTPPYGDIGQTLTGVVVQGANLSGAAFSLSGGGTVTTVSSSLTQATVNITLGQSPGTYIVVATTSSGASSAQTRAGNFFVVYNSPGSNYSDMLFSAFNATGSTPDFPAGSNKIDFLFSVFNATGSTPDFPAGSNETDQTFSVFNATGSTPDFPPGTNYTDQLFSVFNASGSTPLYPAGSNWAWQLFSTENQTGTSTGSVPIAVAQNARPVNRPNPIDPGSELGEPGGRPPLSLTAGQSVQITVRPTLFLQYLELDADRAPLASSTTGSLSLPLTAPFGVDSFSLRAFGYTSFGTTSESLTETVRVAMDNGRTITGQVTDADGSPIPGAAVTWQAPGLAVEYYGFGGQLSAIPDMRGGPARVSFLGALNYPNPQQVFGLDPMGAGLGPNYAARLAGKIQVDISGLYRFDLLAHRGARLTIDGQTVAEGATTGGDAVTSTGGVSLTAGAHDIELTHFESGGAAALQLLWTPPGGVQAVVPPSAITAEAPTQWRAITGSDGRFVLHVPAALDGVAVKLAAGVGSVRLDHVQLDQ